ncbi:MAG: methyltransferase domain-containing protein, partial [Candidatus Hydrogenedentes bacterium]|nr:methyltransferase domain-containing protein [Candidatus Hydrogenedentota bacterium]
MISKADAQHVNPGGIKSTLAFMKEVVRTNRSTGAIAPSSPALAEVVTDMARVAEADVIVEYGPGTGVFTQVIERKRKADSYFIAMEVNPEFVRATRKLCPNVHVYEDTAQNAIKYLRDAGHDGCDCIVSGLPWTRFPEELQDEILAATWDVLRPGGRFVTFAYAFSPLFNSGRRFFQGKLPARFPGMR